MYHTVNLFSFFYSFIISYAKKFSIHVFALGKTFQYFKLQKWLHGIKKMPSDREK